MLFLCAKKQQLFELSSNSTSVLLGDWLILHATPSMFGMFLVHACWQCGGLNEEHSILGIEVKLILAFQEVLKMIFDELK